MNIAIHNLHKLPQMAEPGSGNINGYVIELIKRGYVRYLYFDDYHYRNSYGQPITNVIAQIKSMYSWQDLGLDRVELIFSPKALRSKCDVLLNFNVTRPQEFTEAVKKFEGLKIFHLMDYFWIDPASKKNELLTKYGVDYVFSYSRSDKYCSFFQHYFPSFIGKVIPVPFGFTPRFVERTPFNERKRKCVAIGSVNPLSRSDAPVGNWVESAAFYPDEAWLHKFRRMLVLNKQRLADVMDSMLPEFPHIIDHKYDMVTKLNEYQMFVSCETIFYFPVAKTWEAPAAGSVLVCSDHPCFTDFGFVDGVNCIKHREYDIDDFRGKVKKYIDDQDKLQQIQQAGTAFVRANYTHEAIADRMYSIINAIYEGTVEAKQKIIPSTQAINAQSGLHLPIEVSWFGDYSRPKARSPEYHPETLLTTNRILFLLFSLSWVLRIVHLPRQEIGLMIRGVRQYFRLVVFGKSGF